MNSDLNPLPGDAEKWVVDEHVHCRLGTTLSTFSSPQMQT